jgi:trans-aconitate 2-methyltransferase
MWDPTTYLRYGDERSRPFGELLARIPPTTKGDVVDLGCGPGTLTIGLADRFPGVAVRGLDSSAEMISAARALDSTVAFDVGDVRDWHPAPTDGVVLANAVLQWVPGHDDLLRRWAGELHRGAVLAFQVPGNFDAPSHRLIRAVAAEGPWPLEGVLRGTESVLEPVEYARLLVDAGCTVDAWETTYVHLLPASAEEERDPRNEDRGRIGLAGSGDGHPVLAWVEGTALRPVKAALSEEAWTGFKQVLSGRLAEAYPVHNGKVYFPFRRLFVVATVD